MRLRVLALVTVGAVGALPSAGWALWSAAAAGPATVAADTMSNAGAFRALCADAGRNSTMTLTWTPSPDPYVTGYEIVRTSSAGTVVTTPVPGRTTASWTDTSPTSDKKPVSYTFTIRAVAAGTAWTTTPVSATGVPSYDRNSCVTA